MRNRDVSQGATLLLKLLIATKDRNFFDRLRWSALLRLRQILVRAGDPTVEYDFRGTRLRMPLSHDLPVILREYPLYSDNLGRIAGQLFTKYQNLSIIDVGANIGDSAVTIRRYAQVPILCIEGEPKFAELIGENVAHMNPPPVIEESFVGTSGESLQAVVHNGTARLEPAEADNGLSIRMKSLENILEERPSFQASRLLKIDTDGMDIAILNSAIAWISRQKPVLFFEYDPDLQRAHNVGGLELLGRLRRVGYHRVLVYEADGDYMFSAELGHQLLFSELHEYFSGRASRKYCDLCIFHHDDEDIAEIIRRNELKMFQAARHYLPAAEAGD